MIDDFMMLYFIDFSFFLVENESVANTVELSV